MYLQIVANCKKQRSSEVKWQDYLSFISVSTEKKISFTAETLNLKSNNGVGAQFDGLATENVDLVINAKCSIQPTDDTTWANKKNGRALPKLPLMPMEISYRNPASDRPLIF